ncbi:MAG: helix-turn-helix domain-containing protein [Lachnospiraceae bacterium]|nr:helix-turn-helix domain-containing protein [Lachnospiraceae bacterium]
MEQEHIGRFIADLRKEKNLTQKELADRLGVSDKTVSKWETCNGMPDVAMLKPLCDALGISLNELLSGERLSDENFADRAEDNMLKLAQAAQEKENGSGIFGIICLILGIVLLPSAIIGMIAISSPDRYAGLAYFGDLASLLYIFLFTLGLLLIAGKLKETGKAVVIAAKRGYGYSAEEKQKALSSLSFCITAIVTSGIISVILQAINLLHSLQSPQSIGPCVAVLLISLLYSAFCMAVLLAFRERIK